MAARKKKIDWALVWTLAVASLIVGVGAIVYDEFIEPMLPEKAQVKKKRRKGK